MLEKLPYYGQILVFIGLIIMTPEFNLSNDITKGICFGFISGIFFTGRNLITRKYVREYSSYNLMFWQTLVIGFMYLPILFYLNPVSFETRNIILLIVLGICFTALPHTLFSASFKHLSAKTVSIFGMLLPFYAAFFGYLIHNEIVTRQTAYGGMIIIGCVIYETVVSLKAK